jgi:hypothetical protein
VEDVCYDQSCSNVTVPVFKKQCRCALDQVRRSSSGLRGQMFDTFLLTVLSDHFKTKNFVHIFEKNTGLLKKIVQNKCKTF